MTTLYFNYDVIAECRSEQELTHTLRDLYQHFKPDNPMIRIVHANGSMLYVGISFDGCYINFQSASLEPPYYSSVGDNVEQDRYVHFQMTKAGQITEISKKNTISFDRLLDVATEFHRTGEFPESVIDWEMD